MKCPYCGMELDAGDELIGQKVRCPACDGAWIYGANRCRRRRSRMAKETPERHVADPAETLFGGFIQRNSDARTVQLLVAPRCDLDTLSALGTSAAAETENNAGLRLGIDFNVYIADPSKDEVSYARNFTQTHGNTIVVIDEESLFGPRESLFTFGNWATMFRDVAGRGVRLGAVVFCDGDADGKKTAALKRMFAEAKECAFDPVYAEAV